MGARFNAVYNEITVSSKVREAIYRLRYVRRALGFIWAAARKWTVLWFILLFVQGLIPAAIVYLTKWLVDSVAVAVGAGVSWEAAVTVLVPAGIMAGLMLSQRLMGSLNEWVSTAQAELAGDHIKGLLHARAASADFELYERAEYYDQLEQANSQASSRTLAVLQTVGGLMQAAVTFVSIAALLLQYSVWLPLVLVVSTLPAFFVVLHHNNKYHAWWKEMTPRRRLAQYYDMMLTSGFAAAEVRINHLGDPFRTSYQAIRQKLRGERLDLLRRQVIAKLIAGIMALLVTGATMAWIVWRALRGEATLGDLALFYQAFNQGQSLVGGLLQGMGQIYTNTLFLEHVFDFLDRRNRMVDPAEPAPFPRTFEEGIRIEDVTFTYPGSTEPALENFSLFIPVGKVVAIVGENGAGKSTFFKLLCRFYDPDTGRVTIDGQDLRTFAQADLRRHISAMFQFAMKYQMTAKENIGVGDIDGDTSMERIVEAARSGGAHEFISRLHNGYDTILGRWFATGTELSGGEWQRVALSRAFLRRAPLVILDEPTSFMDSWAETEWLRRFRRVVEGQTALIITHRFSTAMQADIIHVMADGQILESGSHAELIRRGGHYAASWAAQMHQADEQMASHGNGALR